MPDALLLAKDSQICFEQQAFFKEIGFRLKFSLDKDVVGEWLNTLAFDLLLLPAGVEFEIQQKLAYSMWQQNPQGFLVMYDPDDVKGLNAKRVRLLGATLATGDRYKEILQKITTKIQGCKYIKKSEFKVLVVEDLDAARDIICSYIESLGYPRVRGVSSAEEALKIVNSDKGAVDCIITDERMPLMSGHELIQKLRSDAFAPNLPIIVLTAHATQECLKESLQAGASGFLTKPPAKSDLLREMSRAMRVRIGLEKARLVDENSLPEMLELLK